MRRAWIVTGGAAGLLAAGAALAAVSVDVSRLAWRRPVGFEPLNTARRVMLAEDSLLAAGAMADFADVRLMNDSGEAVALDEWAPNRTTFEERFFREIDPVWVEGDKGRAEIRVDLGEEYPSPLTVEFSGPSANASLGIYGSLDSTEWVFLPRELDVGPGRPDTDPKAAGPAFRFQLTDVRRYLRFVREEGSPAPSPHDRIRLLRRQEVSTGRQAVGFRVVGAGFDRGSTNRWHAVLELTGPPRVLTRIDLGGPFRVTNEATPQVESRLPDGGWRWINVDQADRAGTATLPDSLLFEPVRTSALRLSVSNGDAPNAPFAIRGVWATPQTWTFTAEPGRRYWLGYGDPFAVRTPDRTVLPGIPPAATVATLGPPEANPFHRDPGFGLEWLRRRPGILTAAMIAVLGLVAWLTLAGRRRGGAAA